MKYNVPVSGNCTVEADSEQDALRKMEDALLHYDATGMAADILSSLEIEPVDIYPLE